MKNSTYDALVIMTYSSNLKSKDSPTVLSYWSKQVIKKAYQAWKHHKMSKIVIPGETIFSSNKATTGELMKNYLISKKVPANSIKVLSNLNNTAMQLQAVKKLQKDSLGKVLIVCMDFHSKRVRSVINQLSINADIEQTTAQDTVARDETKKLREHEDQLLSNPILRQLWFQNFWTKIFGVRIMDLNEDTYAFFKKIKLFLGFKYS